MLVAMRHVQAILVEMADPMYRVAAAAAQEQELSLQQFVRNAVSANLRAGQKKNARQKARVYKVKPKGN